MRNRECLKMVPSSSEAYNFVFQSMLLVSAIEINIRMPNSSYKIVEYFQ